MMSLKALNDVVICDIVIESILKFWSRCNDLTGFQQGPCKLALIPALSENKIHYLG